MALDWQEYRKRVRQFWLSLIGLVCLAFAFDLFYKTFVGYDVGTRYSLLFILVIGSFHFLVFARALNRIRYAQCANCGKPIGSRWLLNYPLVPARCCHCGVRIGR